MKNKKYLIVLIFLIAIILFIISFELKNSNKKEIDYETETIILVDTPQISLSNNTTSVVEATEPEIYKCGWINKLIYSHKEPTNDSPVTEELIYNTSIQYIEVDEIWSCIEYNNTISYLKTEYISQEKNLENPYTNLIQNLTSYERYLIYQITYAEAGNQDIYGQRCVIEVILNRVLSAHSPNTIYEVLSQEGQFATWSLRDLVTHNQEQEIALQMVYKDTPILSVDYMTFSTHQLPWGKNYIKIGDHWFGTY